MPLDQDVVSLAKAVRQVESGGNFTAQGKSGEFGGYQYTEPTWNAQAKAAGVSIPLKNATREDQNKVFYTWAEQKKKEGYNIGQIASMHNAGEGRPNAYVEGNKGTNSYGVSYDTADYAKKVADLYHQEKSQGAQGGYGYATPPAIQNSTPSSTGSPFEGSSGQATDTGSFNQDVNNRIGEAGQAYTDFSAGKQNIASTGLQIVGAGAGLIGDATNRLIEATPILGSVMKGLEGVIGKGVTEFANTDMGQSVLQSVAQFSNAHPELAKDIGAGFNILTAIPVLKGLGVVKEVALNGASQILKNKAEQMASKSISEAVSGSITGRKILKANPDAIKTIIDDRLLPDIKGGKWDTSGPDSQIEAHLSQYENELQAELQKANVPSTASRINLAQLKKDAMQDAIQQLKPTKPIEEYFNRIQSKLGDYPTLSDLNEAKRTVAGNITENGFMSPTISTDKIVRSALQKGVEDGAKTLGLKDVNAINAKMSRLFKAQKVLGQMNGKTVKLGNMGKVGEIVGGSGAEIAGHALGVPPLVSGFLGYKATGALERGLGNISKKILDRVNPAKAVNPKKAIKTVSGMVGTDALTHQSK